MCGCAHSQNEYPSRAPPPNRRRVSNVPQMFRDSTFYASCRRRCSTWSAYSRGILLSLYRWTLATRIPRAWISPKHDAGLSLMRSHVLSLTSAFDVTSGGRFHKSRLARASRSPLLCRFPPAVCATRNVRKPSALRRTDVRNFPATHAKN